MNENLPNSQPIELTQQPGAETHPPEVTSPLAKAVLGPEISEPTSLQSAEATEPESNPVIEHKKRVDKVLFGPPENLIAQVDNGVMGVNDTDSQGRTPVMMMTARGKREALEELLGRGADPNRIIMFQNRIPMSALDAARQTNRPDLERVLLDAGAKSGRELEAERAVAEQNK